MNFFRAIVLVLLFAASVSGCVAIDPRSLRENVRADSAKSIVGTFGNSASYKSSGGLSGFVASDTLSFALGLHLASSSFSITRPSNSELKIEFHKDDGSSFVKLYSTSADLKIKPNGQFDLSVPEGCGGHDSPGFGCGYKTVTLFINESGDLASIESGGAAGVLGIIPFAMYVKKLAIFPRLE
jgi:hypothetical protein